MTHTVKIRPGVGLLSLFPAMNYKPWFALGEFVDNSIQSYLEHRQELRDLHGVGFKLRIDITFTNGDTPEILVEDNAAGIFAADIDRAFTPAARPPDRSGISQYGIGMKSAATWYSEYYTVYSSALGEEISRLVIFDIKKIVDQEIEELPIEEHIKDPHQHGTRILMRNLHQGIPYGQTLGKIRNYLSSIYRDFIRSGEVIISVGGDEISYAHPQILEAPFWPTDKGPASNAETRQWSMPIDITLSESWEEDRAPGKPAKPPRIRGWMGILSKNSTKQSGVALLWKKKVVVGAGSMAQGDEDSYRPASVFGASTTFPFQRLFGELDLSELQVTTFKDQIDWRAGQEEEFQKKLRNALEEGSEPMLRMARNYRSTLKTPESRSTVEKSLRGSAEAAREAFEASLAPLDAPDLPEADARDVSGEIEAQATIVSSDGQVSLRWEVVVNPGDNQWLRMTQSGSEWVLQLNRAHPFMNSFASLPGADLDPVFRIAVALALAEIRARNAGVPYPATFRRYVNDSLSGQLASRMLPASEEA